MLNKLKSLFVQASSAATLGLGISGLAITVNASEYSSEDNDIVQSNGYILESINSNDTQPTLSDEEVQQLLKKLHRTKTDLNNSIQRNGEKTLEITSLADTQNIKAEEAKSRDSNKSHEEILASLSAQTGLSIDELNALFTQDFKTSVTSKTEEEKNH